jgi:uncharacterized integral membrane protein
MSSIKSNNAKAPTWQRCVCGILGLLAAVILMYLLVVFIGDPEKISLNVFFVLLIPVPYGIYVFLSIAVTGHLPMGRRDQSRQSDPG